MNCRDVVANQPIKNANDYIMNHTKKKHQQERLKKEDQKQQSHNLFVHRGVPYCQMNYNCSNIGRIIPSSKRKVSWQFRVNSCNREESVSSQEHTIQLIWSIHSGKVRVIWNTTDISSLLHKQEEREDNRQLHEWSHRQIDFNWTGYFGESYRILAFASSNIIPNTSKEEGVLQQYNLYIDNQSFFSLPKCSTCLEEQKQIKKAPRAAPVTGASSNNKEIKVIGRSRKQTEENRLMATAASQGLVAPSTSFRRVRSAPERERGSINAVARRKITRSVFLKRESSSNVSSSRNNNSITVSRRGSCNSSRLSKNSSAKGESTDRILFGGSRRNRRRTSIGLRRSFVARLASAGFNTSIASGHGSSDMSGNSSKHLKNSRDRTSKKSAAVIQDELHCDLYASTIDAFRDKIASLIPETESMLSKAIIQTFSTDESDNVEEQGYEVDSPLDMSRLSEDEPLYPTDVQIDIFHDVLKSIVDIERFNTGGFCYDDKLDLMQEQVGVVVSHVRHERLSVNDACQIMLSVASVLGIECKESIPNDTILIYGLDDTATRDDIINTMEQFGAVERKSVTTLQDVKFGEHTRTYQEEDVEEVSYIQKSFIDCRSLGICRFRSPDDAVPLVREAATKQRLYINNAIIPGVIELNKQITPTEIHSFIRAITCGRNKSNGSTEMPKTNSQLEREYIIDYDHDDVRRSSRTPPSPTPPPISTVYHHDVNNLHSKIKQPIFSIHESTTDTRPGPRKKISIDNPLISPESSHGTTSTHSSIENFDYTDLQSMIARLNE